MDQVTVLRQTLQPSFKWHGARLTFVSLFLIALFRVKSVNFSELATGFRGKAQQESHYKRLQRFFRHFEVDYYDFAHAVVSLMDIREPWVLSIDRTQWQFGPVIFNILTLGIVHEGVAFPVLWWMLDKKGNSNTQERIDLLDEWQQLFPQRQVQCLTADREFMGEQWFDYLLTQALIPFRIRIRESDKLSNGRVNLKGKVLFSHLKPHQTQVLRHRHCLWGRWVYVAALKLDDGKLLIVATAHAPKTAITDYAQRWGIETLFGIFKTRGFCLESTHLQDVERLSKLFALLTLALCWAFRTGEWLHQFKPLKLKTHGRRSKSIFRYGFDHLRGIMLNLDQRADEFYEVLPFLSCT